MKVRNLVLFGFVLSALNYLALQAREEKRLNDLDELKNVDLEQLRKQVGDRLQIMVSEFGTAVNSIVNIGSEAFDRYMLDMQKNEDDLKETKVEKKNVVDSNNDDLNNLMAYIKEAFDKSKQEDLISEEKEEISEEENKIIKNDDEETLATTSNGQQEESSESTQEPNKEVAEDEDRLEKSSEEEAEVEEVDVEETSSNEFNDNNIEEITQEEIKQKEDIKEENGSINSEVEVSSCEKENVEKTDESYLPPLKDAEQEKMLADLRELLAEEKPAELTKENDLNSYRDEIASSLKEKDEIADELSNVEENSKPENDSDNEATSVDFDELFSSIFNDEDKQESDENVATETKPQEEEKSEVDTYIDNLISDLSSSSDDIAKEEQPSGDFEFVPQETKDEESVTDIKENNESSNEHIYKQINELYPYLHHDFIVTVYELKETIAENYPLNKHVVVLHRINFKELDDLRQFVEIVSNHGYSVNVDEKKMIVDCFRRYLNTDGKILNNIFEIANQAGLLRGIYEGYWIDIEKDN